MSYGTEGIYGTPVNVSASYIFLFILFGTFLERAGMLKMFTDVALGIFGSLRGGAGKVSVFSSALMGTVSGSGVANVVTTGQLTIPMMKRFGFSSAFSGGVEAAASMGGQIMPPVMGAVSFIMAETLGVEYSVIVMAAIIPALAYFTSCYLMVHLEAGKHNLMGLPKAECPDAKKAFLTNWHLLVPLVLLVYLLLGGFTPLYAGVVSLAITTIIILLSDSVNKVSNKVLHLSIWLGLGALLSYSALAATSILMFLVALCIIINIFIDGGKKTLISCLNALHESAKTAVPVGIACALVGIIIGTMSLTGIGNTVGQLVLDVSDGNLLLSLVFVMLMSIVLGSGVPTIPNYIITSTLAAPVLENMGVPAIAAHMFCFYFGIMADLTPPVALAAFAAAPIAKESHFKISVQASKVGLGGYIVPFAFVYMPVLLMQVEGSIWSAMPEIVYSTVKMLIAMYLMCVAVVGFCKVKTNALERILALSASILFICTFAWSDLIALAFVSVFAFLHYNRANGILLVEGEKISNGA
jgi:TRAP transporter 4TM/12TM fusion protein